MSRRAGQAENGRDGGVAATPPPLTSEPKRSAVANGRPTLRHVDSIVEDEEESSSSNNGNAPPFQSNAAARMRNTSFTASSTSARAAADQRLRAISISNVPHPRHEDGIVRKSSSSKHGPGRVGSQNAAPVGSSPQPQPGMPKRKGKVQKSRESMDLDEVMAGSDGEDADQVVSPSAASPRSPPSTPHKPHLSRAAQDLIAFLDAGPPEEPAYNPSVNGSVISFESSKTRSGRLQRMMSRLTLGGSRESLNGSINEEPPKTPRSLSRKGSKIHPTSPPPPSYKGGSITNKRSIPNVAGASNPYPNVVVATPPPRPPVLQTAASILASSPPASNTPSTQTSTEDFAVSSQPASLSRRGTARKAVPPLEDSLVSPSSSLATESIAEGRVVNGRHARVADDSRDGTPTASPISSPVARRPIALNGHPVKLDTSERPRSTLATSPTSTVDRRSIHAKAESGYASRSASRSPITPSEPPPPPAPAAPTVSASEAEDLRRLLNVATSADECRLLVDMFLVKSGVPLKDPIPIPVEEPTTKSTLEDALALATKGNEEVERGLVALFLGGGGQVDSSVIPLQ